MKKRIDKISKLRSEGLSVAGIAREIGVSRRTVYNDIKKTGKTFEKMAADEERSLGWVTTGVTRGTVAEEAATMSFQDCEDYYLQVPTVFAAINQTAEMVVGAGFYFDGPDEKMNKAAMGFAKKYSIRQKALTMVTEILEYGNSFWERLNDFNIKWLPPRTMEKGVRRHPNGVIAGYAQYMGREIVKPRRIKLKGVGGESAGDTEITFEPEEVLHLKWSVVGNRAYGTSIIQPCRGLIDTKKQVEGDMREILNKHASPYTIFIGKNLDHKTFELLRTRLAAHAAGENIFIGLRGAADMTATPVILDSRARFQEYIDHIEDQITIGLQSPNLIFGRARVRISDASATAINESADRRIRAIQAYMKDILERQVFYPYLQSVFPELKEDDPEKLPEYPELVFGLVTKPTATVREIALMNQSVLRSRPDALAKNQILALYDQMGIQLPEAEKEELPPQQGLFGRMLNRPKKEEEPEKEKEEEK